MPEPLPSVVANSFWRAPWWRVCSVLRQDGSTKRWRHAEPFSGSHPRNAPNSFDEHAPRRRCYAPSALRSYRTSVATISNCCSTFRNAMRSACALPKPTSISRRAEVGCRQGVVPMYAGRANARSKRVSGQRVRQLQPASPLEGVECVAPDLQLTLPAHPRDEALVSARVAPGSVGTRDEPAGVPQTLKSCPRPRAVPRGVRGARTKDGNPPEGLPGCGTNLRSSVSTETLLRGGPVHTWV